MKRLIALVTVLGISAVACAAEGAQPLGSLASGSPSQSRSITPTGTPSPTPTPPSTPTMTFEVWLLRSTQLFVVHRMQPAEPAVATAALEATFAGPTDTEEAAGVETAVPADTSLLDLSIQNRIATVNLSHGFTGEQTPALSVERLAQVVFTLTQFNSVERVNFQVDGHALTNLGGYELLRPQTRADFADVLPAIVVESPAIGARVSSPVTVSGTADVFEAVVSIAILDAHGRIVSSTFTMATCGTGCRGTYSVDVTFKSPLFKNQRGRIQVFEASAKDGSPTNVVEIPVTLVA
jgi:hypothetical protein